MEEVAASPLAPRDDTEGKVFGPAAVGTWVLEIPGQARNDMEWRISSACIKLIYHELLDSCGVTFALFVLFFCGLQY